jgi:hypothetical protein
MCNRVDWLGDMGQSGIVGFAQTLGYRVHLTQGGVISPLQRHRLYMLANVRHAKEPSELNYQFFMFARLSQARRLFGLCLGRCQLLQPRSSHLIAYGSMLL